MPTHDAFTFDVYDDTYDALPILRDELCQSKTTTSNEQRAAAGLSTYRPSDPLHPPIAAAVSSPSVNSRGPPRARVDYRELAAVGRR